MPSLAADQHQSTTYHSPSTPVHRIHAGDIVHYDYRRFEVLQECASRLRLGEAVGGGGGDAPVAPLVPTPVHSLKKEADPQQHQQHCAQLRVVQWNIERGYKLNAGILDEMRQQMTTQTEGADGLKRAEQQHQEESPRRSIVPTVFLLQELDNGCGRSEFEDCANVIAKELGLCGYFAVEFEELDDPIRKKDTYVGQPPQEKRKTGKDSASSSSSSTYYGLHGNGIFSNFYDLHDAKYIVHEKLTRRNINAVEGGNYADAFRHHPRRRDAEGKEEQAATSSAPHQYLGEIDWEKDGYRLREPRRGHRGLLTCHIDFHHRNSPLPVSQASSGGDPYREDHQDDERASDECDDDDDEPSFSSTTVAKRCPYRLQLYCLHLEVFCGPLLRVRQLAHVLNDAAKRQAAFCREGGGTHHHHHHHFSQQSLHHRQQQPVFGVVVAGDLNTHAHSIVRFSKQYGTDRMRWLGMGETEAEWLERSLFLPPLKDELLQRDRDERRRQYLEQLRRKRRERRERDNLLRKKKKDDDDDDDGDHEGDAEDGRYYLSWFQKLMLRVFVRPSPLKSFAEYLWWRFVYGFERDELVALISSCKQLRLSDPFPKHNEILPERMKRPPPSTSSHPSNHHYCGNEAAAAITLNHPTYHGFAQGKLDWILMTCDSVYLRPFERHHQQGHQRSCATALPPQGSSVTDESGSPTAASTTIKPDTTRTTTARIIPPRMMDIGNHDYKLSDHKWISCDIVCRCCDAHDDQYFTHYGHDDEDDDRNSKDDSHSSSPVLPVNLYRNALPPQRPWWSWLWLAGFRVGLFLLVIQLLCWVFSRAVLVVRLR